jgi:pantothenate kinase
MDAALSLTPEATVDHIVTLVRALPGRRVVVGIAGGPGVGKSTIATEVVARLGAEAAYVPMDGFHMRHAKLEALGTVKDKGAPHTFEGQAFAEFLQRLRDATADVPGPGYSRAIEDVVEDQFVVPAAARVLVTEGNYLLLANTPWWRVRPLLDLAVFVTLDREKVRARLMKRHAEHGLFTEERNREHIERVDLANYDLVQRSAGRADVVIALQSEH